MKERNTSHSSSVVRARSPRADRRTSDAGSRVLWAAAVGALALLLAAGCDMTPTTPAANQGSTPAFQNIPTATTSDCSQPVTSAPTGPATVSAKSTAYGKVLAIGSGDYAGCTLYVLTSDQLHSLAPDDYTAFACSDNDNPIGLPCDTGLWPALLTDGAPKAGPGVNPTLLGTVTRSDLPGLGTVQQVTYNGYPLYRFFLDEAPTETDGANLFDPVTSPTGIWYLVEPSRGRVAPGTAHLELETIGSTTVLAVTMDHDFVLLDDGTFPVYTLSTDNRAGPDKSNCQEECAALYWPPVLTSGPPEAGPGVDQHALGVIVRPDGTHQVTYNKKPLYLYYNDAYIPTLPYGAARISGAGVSTPWGMFNTIPSLP